MWLRGQATSENVALTIPYNDTVVTNQRQIVRIDCSYSATPTGGSLSIAVGGVTIWTVDIATAGPFSFDFSKHQRPTGQAGKNIVVTLTDGGDAIVGKLNVKIDER
jgi:hypothetical protein